MTSSRAIIYHRVSTSEQDPTLARDQLRRAARLRELEVAEEIEETGSGARNDRPGLQRVLELTRSGEVSAVLVWKLDRFGRSTLDLLSNIQALNDAGVRLIATSQGLEMKPGGDALSKMFVTVLAAVAEFERELIRERTLLGLAKARKKGVKLGRRRKVTGIQVAESKRLRREGASWREAARQVEASVSSLRRACAENGVLTDDE